VRLGGYFFAIELGLTACERLLVHFPDKSHADRPTSSISLRLGKAGRRLLCLPSPRPTPPGNRGTPFDGHRCPGEEIHRRIGSTRCIPVTFDDLCAPQLSDGATEGLGQDASQTQLGGRSSRYTSRFGHSQNRRRPAPVRERHER